MKQLLIRKAREPMARFVGSALFAQLATFLLAFYLTEGMNHLLNPANMATVSLGAGYIAATGPRIQEKSGRVRKVAPLTVVIPLVLVLVGLPIAVAIQQTAFTPMTRSLLFAPWWLTFIGVFFMFMLLVGERVRERWMSSPLWLKLLAILGTIWGVSLYLFVMVVLTRTYL